MQMILDLQKLEVEAADTYLLGNSCTSSWFNCCNNTELP